MLLIHRGVKIAKQLKEESGPKLKDFRAALEQGIPQSIQDLKDDVRLFHFETETKYPLRELSRAYLAHTPRACDGVALLQSNHDPNPRRFFTFVPVPKEKRGQSAKTVPPRLNALCAAP